MRFYKQSSLFECDEYIKLLVCYLFQRKIRKAPLIPDRTLYNSYIDIFFLFFCKITFSHLIFCKYHFATFKTICEKNVVVAIRTPLNLCSSSWSTEFSRS